MCSGRCRTNSPPTTAGCCARMHGVSLPPGQAEYVTCVRGAVLDVVLDVRVGSPTFGAYDVICWSPARARPCSCPTVWRTASSP